MSEEAFSFPKMAEVRQKIAAPKIKDHVSAIRKELERAGLSGRISPGAKIAVTAGSRGIAHIAEILATVVEEIKMAGGDPFLIPAMGSHGGATPEGQMEILRSLGITPETVRAPIRASMEVSEIGRLRNDVPVYADKIAMKSDGIVLVNRVKPHTEFKDKIESGLMKMMTIGLGKQKGAETVHSYQSEGYHKLIPMTARLILKKAPVIMGLAVVENAHGEIALVKALGPEQIEEEEMELLEKAKDLMARLPFNEIDVLIVEEMGKHVSGLGMDTNVTGRIWMVMPDEKDPRAPRIRRIVVLDLAEESHGNATGLGLADLTTKRLVSKIDYTATFVNSLTGTWPELCRTPPFLPNDRDAIRMGIRACGPINPKKARIVRIKNTLELERVWISESLYEAVKADKELSERIEVIREPREMQFDVLGNLAR